MPFLRRTIPAVALGFEALPTGLAQRFHALIPCGLHRQPVHVAATKWQYAGACDAPASTAAAQIMPRHTPGGWAALRLSIESSQPIRSSARVSRRMGKEMRWPGGGLVRRTHRGGDTSFMDRLGRSGLSRCKYQAGVHLQHVRLLAPCVLRVNACMCACTCKRPVGMKRQPN